MSRKPKQGIRSNLWGATKWLGGVLIFFSLAYGFIWCFDPTHFPITTVKIVGERHYLSTKTLQETTMPYLQDGFFRLKVSSLQQQLLLLPWVKQVDVRKIWPNQLVIHFEEHVPAAYWMQKGIKKGMISRTGTLFFPKLSEIQNLELPTLEGPENKAELVWEQWLKMEKILEKLGLTITNLSLVARGAWQLELSNGIKVILGKNDELNRLRAFVRAYERYLAAKHLEIASVDLRYTSGMAVGWRTG